MKISDVIWKYKICCPMCGHWMLKAKLFHKVGLKDGSVKCGKCGTIVSFGSDAVKIEEMIWDRPEYINVKLDDFAFEPTRAHPNDAGLDLCSPVDTWVYAGSRVTIDTGVHVEIPEGYFGLITSKSGLMSKGITCRGTIDSGYTGSIKAVLYNDGEESYEIRKGAKVTQLVIASCITPKINLTGRLIETERGENGFGSTGD